MLVCRIPLRPRNCGESIERAASTARSTVAKERSWVEWGDRALRLTRFDAGVSALRLVNRCPQSPLTEETFAVEAGDGGRIRDAKDLGGQAVVESGG